MRADRRLGEFRYYILAVDRSTNKAKMVPVAQFYHMQQQIKGYTPTLPTDVRTCPHTRLEATLACDRIPLTCEAFLPLLCAR
jgi:hypothetical protein